MSVNPTSVGLLPTRLRNFFARYPPQIYSALVVSRPSPPKTDPEQTLPSPYTPDREAKGAHRQNPQESSARALLQTDSKVRNPFMPRKIGTGKRYKWIGPRYGLRQQADLVKLAIKYNVEPLLPPSIKSTEYKAARLAERGLAIKGTGIGQKVKGHKWERTMEARLEDRRKAMEGMPEMIRQWKQVSISRISSSRTELTLFYREVTVVAGDSGPSGRRDSLTEPVFPLFTLLLDPLLSLVRHQRSTGFNRHPLGGSICMNHLQGFGMGVSLITFDIICTILCKRGRGARTTPRHLGQAILSSCEYKQEILMQFLQAGPCAKGL
jgi:large subunit ribosomal protein L25